MRELSIGITWPVQRSFAFGDLGLPSDAHKGSKGPVESFKLLQVSSVRCPGLTFIKEAGEYDCFVHLDLGGQRYLFMVQRKRPMD